MYASNALINDVPLERLVFLRVLLRAMSLRHQRPAYQESGYANLPESSLVISTAWIGAGFILS